MRYGEGVPVSPSDSLPKVQHHIRRTPSVAPKLPLLKKRTQTGRGQRRFSLRPLARLVEEVAAAVRRGVGVYVHCYGGIGRTGLLAAALFIRLTGAPLPRAVAAVRAARRGAIRNPVQLLHLWEKWSRPRPVRARSFEFHRAACVRSASAAVSPWRGTGGHRTVDISGQYTTFWPAPKALRRNDVWHIMAHQKQFMPPGRNGSGRGPDAGRTVEFEETDADRTRAWPFLPGGGRV
eukprot:gene11205-biopygen12387